MRYEYYGWIFYAGRLAFNFGQQGLANFLLLSVVTLSISLEIEKLMNESKQILMELGNSQTGLNNEAPSTCIQQIIN